MKHNSIFKFVILFCLVQHAAFSQATFSAQTYPLNIVVGFMVLSDLNGDGNQDIVSANVGP